MSESESLRVRLEKLCEETQKMHRLYPFTKFVSSAAKKAKRQSR